MSLQLHKIKWNNCENSVHLCYWNHHFFLCVCDFVFNMQKATIEKNKFSVIFLFPRYDAVIEFNSRGDTQLALEWKCECEMKKTSSRLKLWLMSRKMDWTKSKKRKKGRSDGKKKKTNVCTILLIADSLVEFVQHVSIEVANSDSTFCPTARCICYYILLLIRNAETIRNIRSKWINKTKLNEHFR